MLKKVLMWRNKKIAENLKKSWNLLDYKNIKEPINKETPTVYCKVINK